MPARLTPDPSTRDRLLDAGLRLFAEHGFRAVSVRRLSEEAGVNIAAVAYHFGGKTELYQGVISAALDETEPAFSAFIDRFDAELTRAGHSRAGLTRASGVFVAGLLDQFLSQDRMRLLGALITREFAFPTSAFDLIYRRRAGRAQQALTRLVAAAGFGDEADPDTRLLAHALIGQVLNFGIARPVVFRRLSWDAYTPERVSRIRRVLAGAFAAALGLPPPSHRENDR